MSILLLTATLSACSGGDVNTELVLNPYETIDFDTTGRALTNLHTHTVYSDGDGLPHDVVDLYHDLDYDILAITDHDEVTYPWAFSEVNENWNDRDPDELGMLDVLGNELTVTRTGWFPDTVSLSPITSTNNLNPLNRTLKRFITHLMNLMTSMNLSCS